MADNLPDRVKNVRRTNILSLLREDSYTFKEIAEKLSLEYHTVRRDVLDLEIQGQVKVVSSRSGAALWSAGLSMLNGWPGIALNERGNKTKSLRETAVDIRRQYYISPASKAMIVTETIFMRILLWANDLRTSHGYQKEDIGAHRAELKQAIMLIKERLHMLESLDSNEKLWTKEGMSRLIHIEDFPGKVDLEKIELYEIPDLNESIGTFYKSTKEVLENAAKRYDDDHKPSAAS